LLQGAEPDRAVPQFPQDAQRPPAAEEIEAAMIGRPVCDPRTGRPGPAYLPSRTSASVRRPFRRKDLRY